MDLIGIGIDLVYIPRIQRLLNQYGERFLRKIFSEEEIEYSLKRKNTAFHLASSFASKEAFFKAVGGYSPFSFKEIILKRDFEKGTPFLELKGKAEEIFKKRGGKKILLALSHENEYTISIVVILGKLK
ncbi:Holo-(acyl-carrier-protein) synthase [Thermodesulfobacterium geofontis OPF15]|jgi:holo-[acyl-carrier protein] synthase|uniref:Holo-[acyl-carrier-protein] synthase n=1 Tax=Thermodesulfobacterium geofontis (strain OPF15) TaxID=795359 RepID=F8C1R1_THEGP|nr:holo-ACP synthase [Thermodesulfobacterium geofontis]AEH22130.1 Holo-(acyl-carrier-protein) synthase [Thermodesulfobacterium geofontis OPF15]